MKITVIIPAYNSASTIACAIASTIRQPLRNLEVLVVDDCSVDQTRAIVREIIDAMDTESVSTEALNTGAVDLASRGKSIRVVEHTVNRGPSAARNSGLAQSTGELVAFLDADDGWLENGLALLYERLISSEALDIVQGKFVDLWPEANGENYRWGEPRFANRLTGVLYRRSVFDTVGPLNESLRKGEDFDFWVRIRHHGIPVERMQAVVSYYTRRPDQTEDRVVRYYQHVARTLKHNLERYREST